MAEQEKAEAEKAQQVSAEHMLTTCRSTCKCVVLTVVKHMSVDIAPTLRVDTTCCKIQHGSLAMEVTLALEHPEKQCCPMLTYASPGSNSHLDGSKASADVVMDLCAFVDC